VVIDPSTGEAKINTFEWLADGAVYKEVWREHARKIVEDERMKECTFKPQIVAAKTTVNLLGSTSKIPRIQASQV